MARAEDATLPLTLSSQLSSEKLRLVASGPHRLCWVDVVRCYFVFGVVAMHSMVRLRETVGTQAATTGFFWADVYGSLFRPSAEVAFMLSGALALSKSEAFFPYMKKRTLRIIVPLLFWMLVYGAVEVHGVFQPPKTVESFLKNFVRRGGHLWFVFDIVLCYLMTPMLSTFAASASKAELRILVALCFLAQSIYPIVIRDYLGWKVYLFEEFPMPAPLGYFLAGHVLNGVAKTSRSICALALLTPCMLVLTFFLQMRDGDEWYWTIGIDKPNAAVLAGCFFLLFKWCDGTILFRGWLFQSVTKRFAELSFGVFIVHMIALQVFFRHMDINKIEPVETRYGPAVGIPLFGLCVASLSSVFVFLIRLVPFVGKIVCP